jgi:3-methylcrotonyl-CoA carboxylase alpha subunit
VSPFYDPMIAKLIVWDENRDRAIARMRHALDEYRIAGVKTNLGFLSALVSHPAFAAAELDTHFIEHHQADLFAPAQSESQQALLYHWHCEHDRCIHQKLSLVGDTLYPTM